MANHAEKNGPFIQHFMESIGSCRDMKLDGDLSDVPRRGGLYVFYIKSDPSSKERFPIYVGITRRTFFQRFKEHAADDGVIDKVRNGAFPANFRHFSIYAYMVPLDNAMLCKFLESILLEAFDFCLNTDENFAVRMNLDFAQGQFSTMDSKPTFNITWKNVMTALNGLGKMYKM